jgi:hypothetical protein
MKRNPYYQALTEIFAEQQQKLRMPEQELTSILEKHVSVQRGLDMLCNYLQLPETVSTGEDLIDRCGYQRILYISLMQSIPKGVDPVTDPIKLYENKAAFVANGEIKATKYVDELQQFTNNQRVFSKTDFAEILNNGKMLYLYFKNEYTNRKQTNNNNPDTSIFTELTTGEHVDSIIEDIARRLSCPPRILEIQRRYRERTTLFFTPAGIYLFNRIHPTGELAQYNESNQDEVVSHFMKIKRGGRNFQKSRQTQEFTSWFTSAIATMLEDKTQQAPSELLSRLENAVFDLSRKYHVKINPQKYDVHKNCLTSRFTDDEVYALDKFLHILEGTVLNITNSVSKRDIKEYTGDPDSAIQMVKKIHANNVSNLDPWTPLLLGIIIRENTFDMQMPAPALAVLKVDFDRFAPYILAQVTSQLYHFLPVKKIAEYMKLLEGSSPMPIGNIEMYGLKEDDFRMTGYKLAFIHNSADYVLSNYMHRTPKISVDQIAFFDSIFKTKMLTQ